MIELSMHILDIVENSVTAGADKIAIRVEENSEKDLLVIEIQDNGKGMNKAMQNKVLDPFVTTKSRKKVGLGLPMLAEAARRSGGEVKIDSKLKSGTVIRASFGLTHVDRQPLGDMTETLITLIVGNPDVDFTYRYVHDGKECSFNIKEIKRKFNNIPLSSSDVLDFIYEEMSKIKN